jgi:hypothetical protein
MSSEKESSTVEAEGKTSVSPLGVNEEEVIGWVRSVVPLKNESDRKTAKISLTSLSGAGGLSSAHMLKVNLSFGGVEGEETHISYVYKSHNDNTIEMSKDMGLAREALFYREFSSILRGQKVLSPVAVASEGDMEKGSFRILMEDLSGCAVQSGYFFGPGSPHNWGKDLAALTSVAAPGTTLRDVTMDCYVQMARMHRYYWKNSDLLQLSWLRGSSYFLNTGKDIWETEQTRSSKAWEVCKQKMADGTTEIRWNSHLVACIDASISKLNWETFLQERQQGPWTLCHGDMHPANIMWDFTRDSAVANSTVKGTSVFVDWQVVGIGFGPQDMAQYVISHTAPADRRLIEKELVLAYHQELTAGENLPEDLKSYSFEQCWSDYVRGGVQRWVWLFCLITSICPEVVSQYFHDQLAAFMEDHEVTPENIGMPV